MFGNPSKSIFLIAAQRRMSLKNIQLRTFFRHESKKSSPQFATFFINASFRSMGYSLILGAKHLPVFMKTMWIEIFYFLKLVLSENINHGVDY